MVVPTSRQQELSHALVSQLASISNTRFLHRLASSNCPVALLSDIQHSDLKTRFCGDQISLSSYPCYWVVLSHHEYNDLVVVVMRICLCKTTAAGGMNHPLTSGSIHALHLGTPLIVPHWLWTLLRALFTSIGGGRWLITQLQSGFNAHTWRLLFGQAGVGYICKNNHQSDSLYIYIYRGEWE